ncbi:MAG: TPR repeat protein [Bradymonadia bacterium]|jgi:TPR repeat protein
MNRSHSLCTVAIAATLLFGCDSASQARSGMTAGAALFGGGALLALANTASGGSAEVGIAAAVTSFVGVLVFMGSATNAVNHLDDARLSADEVGATPRDTGPRLEPDQRLESALSARIPREIRSVVNRCLEEDAESCMAIAQVYEEGLFGVTPSPRTACLAYAEACALGNPEACTMARHNCGQFVGAAETIPNLPNSLPSATEMRGGGETAMVLPSEVRETVSDSAAETLRAELPSLLRRDLQDLVDRCFAASAQACFETGQVFQLGLMTVTASLPAACAAYSAGCELGNAPSCGVVQRDCE